MRFPFHSIDALVIRLGTPLRKSNNSGSEKKKIRATNSSVSPKAMMEACVYMDLSTMDNACIRAIR